MANSTVTVVKKASSQMCSVSMAFYVILVLTGILGNFLVMCVVGDNIKREPGGGRNSDMILINMAFSNLMVSLIRNIPLVITDLGYEVILSRDWCRFLMGVWVWLRAVNVWSTLFLSTFHFYTLRRMGPPSASLSASRGPPKPLLMAFFLIWTLNLLYSVPAFVFSTKGGKNSSETLMLVSSTTRPLLGCIWDFPSTYSGLVFATTSMVIHELIPIFLMSGTNLGSLLILYAHGNVHKAASKSQDAPVVRRVPAERRAAKVILALILLFIISWGASVISVNYFNYSHGGSVSYLLVVARFSNSAFIALSPIVLAVGHRRMREVMKSIMKWKK
ncbi:olfactory receptor class A-like protein 4 [Trichomycterus rosablanca]|uniref:olfactory receptor class A-like protein 4 n=1 Tax=Trichomycterus rosablanca TaxID=2290929 RepID=UPI002F35A2EC